MSPSGLAQLLPVVDEPSVRLDERLCVPVFRAPPQDLLRPLAIVVKVLPAPQVVMWRRSTPLKRGARAVRFEYAVHYDYLRNSRCFYHFSNKVIQTKSKRKRVKEFS